NAPDDFARPADRPHPFGHDPFRKTAFHFSESCPANWNSQSSLVLERTIQYATFGGKLRAHRLGRSKNCGSRRTVAANDKGRTLAGGRHTNARKQPLNLMRSRARIARHG